MQVITKPAYNEEFRTCQFRRSDGQGQLGATETITTASVVCIDRSNDVDTSSTMISDVAPYNNTQVLYKLLGGSIGKTYFLKVRCVTSTSQRLEETFELEIV